MKAQEVEKEETNSFNTGSKESGTSELLCQHKGSGKPHFAHGLCESCHTEVILIPSCISQLCWLVSANSFCAGWCSSLNFLEALVEGQSLQLSSVRRWKD